MASRIFDVGEKGNDIKKRKKKKKKKLVQQVRLLFLACPAVSFVF